MKLWIVGRNIDRVTKDGIALVRNWDFHGVFSTERKAILACRDDSYFIGPATVDEILPEDVRAWPGGYYPKASTPRPYPETPEHIHQD